MAEEFKDWECFTRENLLEFYRCFEPDLMAQSEEAIIFLKERLKIYKKEKKTEDEVKALKTKITDTERETKGIKKVV